MARRGRKFGGGCPVVYTIQITKGRPGFPKGNVWSRVCYEAMADDIVKRLKNEGVGARVVRQTEAAAERDRTGKTPWRIGAGPKGYRTFIRSMQQFMDGRRGRTVDKGFTEDEARRACQRFNNSRTPAQVRKGIKMEYTSA